MKINDKQKQVILEALNKHELSCKRLIAANNSTEIKNIYTRQIADIHDIQNLFTKGQLTL